MLSFLLPRLAILSFALLAACTPVEPAPPNEPGWSRPAGSDLLSAPRPPAPSGGIALPSARGGTAAGPAQIELGTGRFTNLANPAGTAAPPIAAGPDVTLDFAGVDIRDVARSVLGELLRVTYVVDPGVQGTVTLQTGRPVPRAQVPELLAATLRLSGAALVVRDGLYQVIPLASAGRDAPLAGGGQGFVTRIVTPRYVAAADLEKAMEAVVPTGSAVRADPGRNTLTVSGPARDVSELLVTIGAFDADYLQGMSFALLPLRNGRAREVAADVSQMLAASGRGMPELVKVIPINRMNAVLVTSMQPSYIARIRTWVERMDRGDGRGEAQLFVYRVQNGRAAELAAVLRRALGVETTADPAPVDQNPSLYGGQGALGTMGRGGAAFGTAGGTLGGTLGGILPGGGLGGGAGPGGAGLGNGNRAMIDPLGSVGTAAALANGGVAPPGALTGPGQTQPLSDIRITADVANNALIIAATGQEYGRIEAALQKLDIVPLQVLIEATIAEVTLSNELSFGLQYFFKSNRFSTAYAPGGFINSAASAADTALSAAFPGFSLIPGANFAFTSASGSSAVIKALSEMTAVRVLSSPNLLVMNNRSARLQVGDQVPVATQSAISTITPNAPEVNTIDYRDTGVILTVTPRVNTSGLVHLDIAEEVSEVIQTTSSKLNSPTISQRRLTSSVAALDGQTIGLGGLIRDVRSDSSAGVPVLKDIPVVGYLFGGRTNSGVRTELIVLLTPHVIRSQADAEAATQELRDKLPLTVPVASRRRR